MNRNATLTLDFLAGVSVENLSRRFGISIPRCYQVINQLLQDAGLPYYSLRRGMTNAEKERAWVRVTNRVRQDPEIQDPRSPAAFYYEMQREVRNFPIPSEHDYRY